MNQIDVTKLQPGVRVHRHEGRLMYEKNHAKLNISGTDVFQREEYRTKFRALLSAKNEEEAEQAADEFVAFVETLPEPERAAVEEFMDVVSKAVQFMTESSKGGES